MAAKQRYRSIVEARSQASQMLNAARCALEIGGAQG